ncbi:MAG: RluA family pseudouridine synthase [Caldimicrobium sp.]
MAEKIFTFEVDKLSSKIRLDHFLKEKIQELTRNRIQKLIEEGFVKIQPDPGVKVLKPGYKIKEGQIITLIIPPEEPLELKPQEVPFEVLYEDDDLAVIYKPAGVVVHPAPGHKEGTLVHGLLYKLKNLSGIGGKLRPGIVHRLDKDTSGLMLIAKNDFTHQALVKAFKERKIKKEYLAILYGQIQPPKGKIEKPIGRHPVHRKKMAVLKEGKEAITEYEVLEYFKKATLVCAKPITGRTHQLRVHFNSLGHPILGDPLYEGLKPDLPKPERLMLHAAKLTFLHPRTKKLLSFHMDPPKDFKKYLQVLEKINNQF